MEIVACRCGGGGVGLYTVPLLDGVGSGYGVLCH